MKKRKILALMIACVTMLSLVACGGNETETETNDNVTADTVVTEDAPMDAPVDVPVEKENWTDMVVTEHIWDAINRHSTKSHVLKECTHDELLGDAIEWYEFRDSITNEIITDNTIQFTWDNTIPPYGVCGNTPYETVGVIGIKHYNDPILAGIKMTLSDKEPRPENQKCGYYEFSLPAGITCGSTIAEVEAAYGTPTSTDVTAESCTVYRYDDADKHLVLEFDANSTVHSFEYYYDLNGYTEAE